MTRRMRGRIDNVFDRPVGDILFEDTNAGATVILLNDAIDFEEDGGQLSIDGHVYDYIGVDDAADTVTLAIPTIADYEANERVLRLPLTAEKTAVVVVKGESDGIEARVPHYLYPMIEEAVRNPGLEERATLKYDEGEWVLEDVWGVPKQISSDVLTGDPPPGWSEGTDGDPPATSPTPALEQFGVGGLKWFLTYTVNPDPCRVRVYASTTDPPPIDPANLIADTSAISGSFHTIDSVRLLPDDANDPIPLVYVRAVQYDFDGDAPPGATSVGLSPRRASGPDIAADYVYANNIQANQVEGGTFIADLQLVARLLVGNFIALDGDASSFTVYADTEHTTPIIQLRPEGSVFRGQVIADDVSVLNGLILQGMLSRVENEAVLTLANGVENPSAGPTVTAVWPKEPWAGVPIPTGHTLRGVCDHPTSGHITRLLYKSADKTGWLQVVNLTTGAQVGSVTALGDVTGFTEDNFAGIVYKGSRFFVGVQNYNDSFYEGDDGLYLAKFNSTISGGEYPYISKVAVRSWIPGQDRGDRFARLGVDYINNAILVASALGNLRSVDNPTMVKTTLTAAKYATDAGGTGRTPSFLGFGPFDYGADRFIAALDDSIIVASSATDWQTMDEAGDAAWPNAAGAYTFWHDTDDQFYTYSGGSLYLLAPHTAGAMVWASYADTDGADHTAASPKGTILVPARKYGQVQLPPAAPTTTGSDVYVGYGATEPAPTAMWERTESLPGNRIMVLADGTITSGATQPTVSTFGAGAPGKIKSAVNDGYLDGAGGGDWPLLASRKFFAADLTADFSIPNNVETIITAWVSNPTHNNMGDGFFSYNGTTGELTVLRNGFYLPYAQVKWANNSTSFRDLHLYRNDVKIMETTRPPGAAKMSHVLGGGMPFLLAAGDILTVKAKHAVTGGGALLLDGNSWHASYLCVAWMGDS